jgi:SAM-dependent methyltransferase
MNQVPTDLHGQFDFVWSACCFEHLGSLRHGMDFVRNSSRCLKPGGIAVHTTEFNLSSKTETMETPPCSVYRESDIRTLLEELHKDGFETAPLNLNTGGEPVDRHIDLPPYGFSPHLKLMLEGIVVTSIGLIIRRPQNG